MAVSCLSWLRESGSRTYSRTVPTCQGAAATTASQPTPVSRAFVARRLRDDGHGASAPGERGVPAPPRSGNHHDLGLFGVGAQPRRPRGSLGLYHLAWQVDTVDELEEARATLLALDGYTGESSHGATKSVYGHDPDGNEFEVMWMLPRAAWGEYAAAAPVEHLDLSAEVTRWGGVRTAAELVPQDPR